MKIFVAQLVVLGLIIFYGLQQYRPTDFYHLHSWMPVAIVIELAVVIGFLIWSFKKLFPEAPKFLVIVPFALGLTASVALLVGLNYGAERSETVAGPMTRYTRARATVPGSTAGKYGEVQLPDGTELDIPLSLVQKLNLVIGDQVSVELHHGRFFDWGSVSKR